MVKVNLLSGWPSAKAAGASPESPSGLDQERARVQGNLGWLTRLRWVAIAGQCTTVALVRWIWQVPLPYMAALLSIIVLTALSNAVLHIGLSRRGFVLRSPRVGLLVMAGTMTVDLVLLTALLYFSGGPTNPFSFFYLVNLALAAILLPGRWAMGLTLLAIACFAGFFLWGYVPIHELEQAWQATRGVADDVRKQGLVVAFAACALVNTYFISRVAHALWQREAELRQAEQRRARSERLEALATLAAGAGHELASPLSTIAVIAKELSKHLEGTNVPSAVLEDVALIRSELDHCRAILNRMSAQAGQVVGEQVGQWTLRQIVEEIVSGIRRSDRVVVYGLETSGDTQLQVPIQAMALAIRGLIQNGLDASPTEKNVELHLAVSRDHVTFRIVDYGSGMSDDVLRRAGEPFFTTKEPGQGMGLGLFLTRNVIERLGGQLILRSRLGQGTTVEVMLPRVAAS